MPRTFTHAIVKRGSDPVITVDIIVHGPPPTDTAKPTKVNCDTLAVNRATTATQILDDLDKLPQMKQLRDSAAGSHEVALSGYDSSSTTRYFPGSFAIGASGSVPQVTADTTTGPNHKNVNSLVHLHEKGIDPNVDCADLYNLLHRRTVPTSKNRFLNHSFVIGGDTMIDLAVVVYDTTIALSFINAYHRDTAVAFDSSGPMWSPTYRGEFNTYPQSMGKEFDKAVTLLRKNHYPENMLQTYAQVYMMERYNMGIKMLISTSSGTSRTLKELSPIITRDAAGRLKDLKIKICQ